MPSVFKLWLQADDRFAWLQTYLRRKKRKILRPKVMRVDAEIDFRYRLRKWFGLYLMLDTTSTVDRRIFEQSAWELDQLYLMERACKYFKSSGDFEFVDVGSYWGLYAMKAIHWGAYRAIAFEPDAKNYAHLRAHLLLNNLINEITTHSLAVSSMPCSLSFFASDKISDGNRGAAKVVVGVDGQSETVQSVRLDDILPISGAKIVIKIDVEGHEIFALQGMQRLCRENTIFVQVEVWSENRLAVCQQAQQLGLKFLHSIEDDLYFSNECEMSWFDDALQNLAGFKTNQNLIEA